MLGILAAEYTRGGRGRPAALTLNRIVDGRRNRVMGFNVANQREARQLAKQYAAKPWNF
jgi:hypothetical protein